MITPKKTLYKWFSNFMKPAQEHFRALIDSFYHKNEPIPMSSIEGLSKAIENTASAKQLLNHLNDTNAHRNLFDKKVDKEEGKGLSSNDFTSEHKQKLEGLQPTDVSGLLPKGEYDGTGQQLKEAIDGLQTKMQQVETTLSVDDADFDTLQEIATQVKSNKNLETLLTGKVNKEEGKGLSANDFTNELKQKLEGISPLVGKYFSSNLIQGNTEYLKSDVYQSGITHELRLIGPFIKGKCLLSYVGNKLGEGVTMKFLSHGTHEVEIKGELLHTDNETGTQYYLLETDDTGYLKGANFYTNKIKVELQGANSIGNLQLKRILTLPEWEAEKGFYNTYAKEIAPEGSNITAGRCNLVPTYGRNREVLVFYEENVMFSVVKSGYNDEGKITFSGINGTIEGDTEITGKVGSRAEAICMNGKIYITVHNKV
jgi:hypothetical protein